MTGDYFISRSQETGIVGSTLGLHASDHFFSPNVMLYMKQHKSNTFLSYFINFLTALFQLNTIKNRTNIYFYSNRSKYARERAHRIWRDRRIGGQSKIGWNSVVTFKLLLANAGVALRYHNTKALLVDLCRQAVCESNAIELSVM